MAPYVRLLGLPAVRHGHAWLQPPYGKTAALLYYLAYRAEWVPRQDVILLLWADTSERKARASLRNLLSKIRRTLPYAGELEAQEHLLRWPVRTDVGAIRRAIAAGNWLEAARVEGGMLLEGFDPDGLPDFSDWLDLERQEILGIRREALYRATGDAESIGGIEGTIDAWERLHRADPWDEDVLRRYLGALHRTGRDREAMRGFEAFRDRLQREVGGEPDAATRELADRIRAAIERESAAVVAPPTAVVLPDAPTARRTHNLRPSTTPFIGRDREVQRILQLLADPACRLLTLLAPGGIGKTRLAVAVAEAIVAEDRFADGVWFVPLAAVEAREQIAYAVAGELGIVLPGDGDPEEQLLRYLAPMRSLLVLDNLEHLAGCAEVVVRILERAPGVKILATSRERLDVRPEWLFALEGLDVPDEATTDPYAFDSVQLFMHGAQRAGAHPSDASAFAADVARICRLVEGMPLAIELAAGWLPVLGVHHVLSELEAGIGILESAGRDLPDRHRSVRVAFEGSWERLGEGEQRAFRKMSVFRGGFTLDAARVVTGASLEDVRSLVHMSLLTSDADGRYGVHELLRQFAAEKLDAAGETDATLTAHGEHYLGRLRDGWDGASRRGPARSGLPIEADLENVRKAWKWAVDTRRNDALDASLDAWFHLLWSTSRFTDGRNAFAEAIAALDGDAEPSGLDRLACRLSIRHGGFARATGSYDAAYVSLRRGLEMARALEMPGESALAQSLLAELEGYRGEPTKARRLYEESLALSRTLDDPRGAARALQGIAWLKGILGEYEAASRDWRESLAYFESIGAEPEIAFGLDKLGHELWKLGANEQARVVAEKSLERFRSIGDRLGVANALGSLALIALDAEELDRAEALMHESLALCVETNHRMELAGKHLMMASVRFAQHDLTDARAHYARALDIYSELDAERSIGVPRAHKGLGDVALAAGDPHAARRSFVLAVETARKGLRPSNMLEALTGVAALLVRDREAGDAHGARSLGPDQAKLETAATLLTLVADHPATWNVVRCEARRWLHEVRRRASEDPADEVLARARRRAAGMDLDRAVELALG